MDKNKIIKIVLISLTTCILLALGYFGYLEFSKLKTNLEAEKTNLAAEKAKVEQIILEKSTLTSQLSELQSTLDGYKKKELEAASKKAKVGKVKFSFSFPSEFRPAFRVCFTNNADKSLQYCFWKKSTSDSKNYTDDLSGDSSDTVTLPVGNYTLDYTSYTFGSFDGTSDIEEVSQSYFLNECVYYSDGTGENMAVRDSVCKSFEDKLNTSSAQSYLPFYLVNNDGGKAIVINVKENKTVTLKNISLQPYFDLN